ncbi:MAG TPA: DNA repair protein RadA [Cryomorphaceae bacterium]|nr:DNA repair protein RadA [Cryomorphaceae bacterium]
MAKAKTVFFCTNCGYESPRWLGQCPSCREWNRFSEEVVAPRELKSRSGVGRMEGDVPEAISQIKGDSAKRLSLGDVEMERTLGGGLVPGSVVLLAGEPGIGKSTLMLQTALRYTKGNVLYVSGEESKAQIAGRGERIGALSDNCFLLGETDPATIVSHARKLEPHFLIVDSVQTLESGALDSAAGSVSQIRESTAQLIRYAKTHDVAIFLIGHITKEGQIAGPKVLEHMVDTVLVFEGDQQHMYRLLRCSKNRFGGTNELGIYEMEGKGLRPVENPSELLRSPLSEDLSGSASAAIIEGVRPLIIEVQALVSSAVYGTPRRSATGFDVKRLQMLLAVLEKRCGFQLGAKDVFLNIAGGLKVNDPSIDLAVTAAVLSSSEDLSLPRHTCFAGEVGLSGEIRPVTHIDTRISEASKLGFRRILIAKAHKEVHVPKDGVEVVRVAKVNDMLRTMFG